ncbi:hypothetical protein Hdeb2414_s0009g00313031 [Helianthus debilis subsp. tardiflorus]
MSLYWRMEREDKSVYMEGDKIVSLYVVAYKRENGKMATIPKRADKELWYLQIVKNFALPRDEDLAAQPPTGSEKSAPTARAKPSSVVNDDLPPSPPRESIKEQLEGTKAVEDKAEKVAAVENPEVEKPVEVEVESEKVVAPETADVDVVHPKSHEVVARNLEKRKSIPEDLVITIPTSATTSAQVNIVRSPSGDQGFFAHNEENSPIRPEETRKD